VSGRWKVIIVSGCFGGLRAAQATAVRHKILHAFGAAERILPTDFNFNKEIATHHQATEAKAAEVA